MAIEAALIKPVVDALMALFRESSDIKLKRDAEKALREAIHELLQANPDENKAQARIAESAIMATIGRAPASANRPLSAMTTAPVIMPSAPPKAEAVPAMAP